MIAHLSRVENYDTDGFLTLGPRCGWSIPNHEVGTLALIPPVILCFTRQSVWVLLGTEKYLSMCQTVWSWTPTVHMGEAVYIGFELNAPRRGHVSLSISGKEAVSFSTIRAIVGKEQLNDLGSPVSSST